MDAFKTHKSVVDSYSTYIKSFIDIKDQRIRELVEKELASGKLWPDPLIQFNPAYAPGMDLDRLCTTGVLHSTLGQIFKGLKLYRHQEEALRLGCQGRDFVVTSGTGSGKSLAFLGTIFQYVLKASVHQQGIKAIIVYPMNALINSQTLEITGYKDNYEKLTGIDFPISFAQYTGQEKGDIRQAVIKNPPDILLTNYMMLELLLTRSAESDLRDSIIKNLELLVFDELHTYRGRQGSDVAILIRRLQAIAQKKLICIGTSATMISGTSISDQKKRVAEYATTIFGRPFSSEQIINEALQRNFKDSAITKESVRSALNESIDIKGSYETFLLNHVAIWLETHVALEENEGVLIRKKPQRFSEIAKQLSSFASIDESRCSAQLKQILAWADTLNKSENPKRSILPFKMHQFIAQTGSVYATLEPAATRKITLEASYSVPSGESSLPIYPIVFSRASGKEFLCVAKNMASKSLTPRDFRERLSVEDEENIDDGYLILDDIDGNIWNPATDIENLPDSWLKIKRDGTIEIANKYKAKMPQRIFFNEQGGYTDIEGSSFPFQGWFIPAPLLFDPTSGIFL